MIFHRGTGQANPHVRIQLAGCLVCRGLTVFYEMRLIEDHHIPFLGGEHFVVPQQDAVTGDDCCVLCQNLGHEVCAGWPVEFQRIQARRKPLQFVFPVI